MQSPRIFKLPLAFLLILPLFVRADPGYLESDPNGTPADFHAISGEVTLYGTMLGLDGDGYLWTIFDNDARKRVPGCSRIPGGQGSA